MKILRKIIFSAYAVLVVTILSHGQGNLTVSSSTVLTADGGAYITINDAQLIANGTFAGNNNSTVEIAGTATAENSKIGGSGNLSFNNLIINKTSNDGKLAASITVNNILTLQTGSIDIQGNTIDLGTTGSLNNETNATRIYGTNGTITATGRSIALSTMSNVANLGAEITPNGASITNINVTRGVASQTGAGSMGIYRYYDLTTTPATALNATLTIHYFDAEYDAVHGGTDEATYDLWRSTDAGTTWIGMSATPSPASNSVTLTGIDQFSRWTVSSYASNALPIKLLNFTAKLKIDEVLLQWTSALENNFDYYQIERSTTGKEFEVIGKVPGAGYNTDNILHNYSFIDASPFYGVNYYRLTSIDLDHHYEYYHIVRVLNDEARKYFYLFPNPSAGYSVSYKVNFNLLESDVNRVVITNSLGITVTDILVNKPTDTILFTNRLNPGVYFVKCISPDFADVTRLIVRD